MRNVWGQVENSMPVSRDAVVLKWKAEYKLEELERAPCPMCGADRPAAITREWGLGIVRCTDCDLMYVSPRLRHPERNYWDGAAVKVEKYGAILRGESAHPRDVNYREHLDVIARHQPHGRLLDIGTHCGFFLRMARNRNWELYGVEASASSAAIARDAFGLNIFAGLLGEANFPERHFQVITLVDVLEHVTEPRRLLNEVHRVLADEGVLFIKVPNGSYNLLKLRVLRQFARQTRFDIFDAREHVVHYTVSTLGEMLRRARLQVVQVYVPRPIQSGARWQKVARAGLYRAAQMIYGLTGFFSAGATDIAIIARRERAA